MKVPERRPDQRHGAHRLQTALVLHLLELWIKRWWHFGNELYRAAHSARPLQRRRWLQRRTRLRSGRSSGGSASNDVLATMLLCALLGDAQRRLSGARRAIGLDKCIKCIALDLGQRNAADARRAGRAGERKTLAAIGGV